MAGEIMPDGLKSIKGEFYILPSNGSIWQFTGTIYGWKRIDNPLPILKSEYTALGGETSFTIPELIGRNILLVSRTTNIKVVTGLATGTNISFNDSTGKFTVALDHPLILNEYILILSQSGTAILNNTNDKIIKRVVDTYVDMEALLSGDNPTKVIEYTVLIDDTNDGAIGHYTHYNNKLTYFAEGEIS